MSVCVCFVFHQWHQTLGSLIRSRRKCAFHLPFLQVASVRLVSDTSFLADNTRGLNQHFPPVKTVPLFRANIIVNLSTCVYLQPSIKLILMSCAAVKWVSPSYTHPWPPPPPPHARPPPPATRCRRLPKRKHGPLLIVSGRAWNVSCSVIHPSAFACMWSLKG